jgi:SAM-dependent methyltransferase
MEHEAYTALRAEEETYWWYRGLHRLVVQLLRMHAPQSLVSPGESLILDAGCGTGGMLAALMDHRHRFGIDLSPLALHLARDRSGLRLCRGTVERLPFSEASFDLVLSLDVLYHRAVASDRAALGEMFRCLKPGGTLLLNLPAYEALRSSHDQAVHTARRYRRRGLRALLEDAGFQVIRLTHWNTLLFPGLALVRLARRRHLHATASRPAPAGDVAPLPPMLNRLLLEVLVLEHRILRWTDFPFGLSLVAVARRPQDDGAPR